MTLHLHLRVASRNVAEVSRQIVPVLSRSFLVTALHGQRAGEIRLHVDGMSRSGVVSVGDRPFPPRVDVLLRPGWGPTVELLLLRHRSRLPGGAEVGVHAEAVSNAVIRYLECGQSHAGGIEGHWRASCGWYLHFGSTNFYFERDVRRNGCLCAARWHESCAGGYEVNDSFVRFRYVHRHLFWQGSAFDAGFGVHDANCAGAYAGTPDPPPPTMELLQFKIVDRWTISLAVPDARSPLVTLKRIAGNMLNPLEDGYFKY